MSTNSTHLVASCVGFVDPTGTLGQQHGNVILYELGDDTPIVYERTDYEGRPALLMGHADRFYVILAPPDAKRPWRRSSPGHVREYGRRISVREALDYAGDEHRAWTIEQTTVALGETLTAIRAVQDRALSGREPESLAELTRLADRARGPSKGLQTPLA